MKPIAQTFLANEPSTGVEAVYLTGVDLFFQSASSTYGVELQVRETVNGVPTQSILPFASKIIPFSSVSTSPDASVATNFTFDTPVILMTNTQYALVVVPVAGNPDYTIWTAALGDNDATTGTPIYTNNQLGSLFISSNDLNFTAVQNESMKYNLYTATFTGTSGSAVYKNANSDFFRVKDIIGTFQFGESVVVSNSSLFNASMTIGSPNSNTFIVGETVNQSNSSAVYANGVVYFSNTTFLLLSNVQGIFTLANTLTGVTSGKITPAPTNIYQNVVTTSACNIITVPDANTSLTTDFAVNNFIYVGTNTRSTVQVVRVTAADVVNRRITVSSNINFADSSAIIGRVKSDASLFGVFSSKSDSTSTYSMFTLDNVTSNAASNFAARDNQLLIGTSSGASARNVHLLDLAYDSITSQFSYITPKLTNEDWNFQGISLSKSIDSVYTLLTPDTPYEFTDTSRLLMSRSNEFANPIGGNPGQSSLTIKTDISSANSMISPYIDNIRKNAVLTHNHIKNFANTSGYILGIANANGFFNRGDTVSQSNSTTNSLGIIVSSNSSTLTVASISSSNQYNIATFNANGSSIITDSNNSAVANVMSSVAFSEDLGNGIELTRYISKNVILDTGQDAEDFITYLGAYRPPGTNLYVYARCLAAADGDAFNNKAWSFMPETSSPALLSSLVNRNDLVELTYDLPQSINIYSSGGSGNNTSSTITVPTTGSTLQFTAGQYIYVTDASPAANGFNVRQVVGIPNTTSLIVSANLSFISGNLSIGTIPGLNTQTATFRYDGNQNVARYSTSGDSIYDTVKTFAIKIVLTSNTSQVVPRISDMRTIAMQA